MAKKELSLQLLAVLGTIDMLGDVSDRQIDVQRTRTQANAAVEQGVPLGLSTPQRDVIPLR